MAGTTPVLVCRDMRKRFGARVAVDGVSFEIAPGERYGLLGPNGAGKTTTISMVCGLARPDSGAIAVAGHQVNDRSPEARALIGYVPQEIALYPDLSGRENLRFFARLYGLRGKERDDRVHACLELVGLADRAGELVSVYSGGMQRRLNIAAGLLHRPQLLVLDEPTVGVDPQSRAAILDSIEALGTGGMAVLYTTHYMGEAERLCDRIGILDEGRLVAEGTREELIALVGGHDQVRLSAAGDPEALARSLDRVAGVHAASAHDGAVVVDVEHAHTALPLLLQAANAAGAGVSSVDVTRPDLETVFLHLTGKALRIDRVIAFTVAGKDLRQRVRDRSAIVVAVVAPFAIAAIISAALGGVTNRLHATYALVDQDRGPVATAFAQSLRAAPLAGLVTVRVVPTVEAARALTATTVDAAFVVPAGFSAAVTSGRPAQIDVIRSRSSLLAGQIAVQIADGFAQRVNATALTVRTTLAAGVGPTAIGPILQGRFALDRVTLTDSSAGGRTLGPASYYAPAMALFFLFFSLGLASRSVLSERASGTLRRLRAAPIPAHSVLAGKAIAGFVVGMTSMIVLVISTRLLLGTRWGSPGSVLALVIASVVSILGLMLLVTSLASTEEQAAGYSSGIGIVLALLGGSFIQLSLMPAAVRRIGAFTPNGLALRSFTDLATNGAWSAELTRNVAVLLVIGMVTGGIGLARSAKVMSR